MREQEPVYDLGYDWPHIRKAGLTDPWEGL